MNPSGSTLGKYQIIREIARSNDIVYEAYDPIMNRRVAVKELNIPAGTPDQQKKERIDRFNREAKALGTVQHPNIMTVYEFGEDAGRYFLVMELLDGVTLRNKIDSSGKMTPEEAFPIMKEVLKGLSFAHSKGIIHRDIKPDNIQILSDGRVKITDFGIARLTFEPNITMDGQTFGTPSYMSPEQVIGKDIDFRSDLFSVGVILYEMISGAKPFQGDSVVSISHAVLNSNPPNIDTISYSVDHVIHKAMEKTPAMRFSSADEMISAMDQALTANDQPWGAPLQDPYASQSAPPLASGTSPVPPPVIAAPPAAGYSSFPMSSPPYSPQYVPPSASYSSIVNGPYVPQSPTSTQYGYVPNPSGQPIYVARPRRTMSDDTKKFFSVLFWAIVILLTVVFVLIIFVQSFGITMNRAQRRQQDEQQAAYAQSKAQGQPIERQISEIQSSLPQLTTPTVKEQQNEYLAHLYSIQAQTALASGSFSLAEASYNSARQYDPDNPNYVAGLSSVYRAFAQSAKDAQNRELMWHQSVQVWIAAGQNASSSAVRSQYLQKAAEADLGWAQSLMDQGSYAQALDPISMAEGLHLQDPVLAARISQFKLEVQKHSAKDDHQTGS